MIGADRTSLARGRVEQLEHRVPAGDAREGLRRGAGRDGKVALDGRTEAGEVCAEDPGLVGVRDGTEPASPAPAAPLQDDLARDLGVAHPLGASAARYEPTPPVELEHVDGRGERAAR